jgi:uncharacterized iron-regulated protein
MVRAVILRQLMLAAAAALAGCAHAPALEGGIWDTHAGAFVSESELFARAESVRYVILGEIHDNAEHHRLQLALLQKLPGKRILAMEQFDSEHQAAIDAARPKGAEAVADAGRFDRKGWNWPLYKPLVQFALDRGWPLAAANLSRAEARAIVADPSHTNLPLAAPGVIGKLEKDIVEGHCGQTPEATRLAGMVAAQRARDARMASVLKEPGVLVAGRGHARRDRGVPAYLGSADVVSIAFTEADASRLSPREYDSSSYDYLWFTMHAVRDDPCS